MTYNHSAARAALTRALAAKCSVCNGAKTVAGCHCNGCNGTGRNRSKVLTACRAAVALWNAPGNYWPDDWSRWQRALGDVFPVFSAPRIDDWRL